MAIILTVLYTFLGWLVGILINHVADILPRRQSVWQWPACSRCQTRRPYLAWSAVVAYLSGRQRCPQCGLEWGKQEQPEKAVIQEEQPEESVLAEEQQEEQPGKSVLLRSIIVELVTPAFFLFLVRYYGFSIQLGLVSVYTAILILVTVTDLEHRLILNVVMLPAILLGFIAAFFTPDLSWQVALVGGAVAFILSYVAAVVSRGGLGSGDVTLSTFLGLVIGFPYIILSLLLGVCLGGLVAFLLLITGRVGLKTFIPYGPFLTITGWIMLIWGTEIWWYYF